MLEKEDQGLTRREFLRVISVVVIGSINFSILGCGDNQPTPERPIPSATALPLLSVSERSNTRAIDEIINSGANKLGIKESASEKNLWPHETIMLSSGAERVSKVEKESGERLEDAIEKMLQSENPFLRNSAAFLREQSLAGKIKMLGGSSSTSLAGVMFLPDQNVGYAWVLGVDPYFILESPKLDVALTITHEMEHIKNGMYLQDQLPENTTINERTAYERGRRRDPIEHIAEEARGYGVQSQAVIYQRGLVRDLYISYPSSMYAAAYVRAGVDASSPFWKEFVRKEILRIS